LHDWKIYLTTMARIKTETKIFYLKKENFKTKIYKIYTCLAL